MLSTLAFLWRSLIFFEFVQFLLLAPEGLDNGHTAQVLLNEGSIEVTHLGTHPLEGAFNTLVGTNGWLQRVWG